MGSVPLQTAPFYSCRHGRQFGWATRRATGELVPLSNSLCCPQVDNCQRRMIISFKLKSNCKAWQSLCPNMLSKRATATASGCLSAQLYNTSFLTYPKWQDMMLTIRFVCGCETTVVSKLQVTVALCFPRVVFCVACT